MIVNILFFFSLYSALYGSTPRPQEPNELFKAYKEAVELSARYNNLQDFYRKNFTYFYEIVQELEIEEVKKLFESDEWLPKKGKMFPEEIFNDIRVFFKSLLDKSKKDVMQRQAAKEEEITCKNELLENYLPSIFYGLLFHTATSVTSDYYFFGEGFSFKGEVLKKQSCKITKRRNSNPIFSEKKSLKPNEISSKKVIKMSIPKEGMGSKKNSYKSILDLFPKNLFHRYFTPFEIFMLSSFLIKKFVSPSTTRNFLNNSFGSNFTKKQGVRYLEKYLLPHTGKFFIGAAMLHGLSGGVRSVNKELDKLG